jgi:hypothetical protein
MSLVLIPSVLSVGQNMFRLLGRAYESTIEIKEENFEDDFTFLTSKSVWSFVMSNKVDFMLVKEF